MMTAMAPPTYRDWNVSYGKPFRRPAYDRDEAQRRWEAGETFFVLFGDDPEHPTTVLEVELGGTQVVVHWLDEHARPVLTYLFAATADGKGLFLEQTGIKRYDQADPSPTDEATHHEAYWFDSSGTYQGTRGSRGGQDHENTAGTLDPEQLAGLHEPALVFGDWDSITRRDR